MKLSNLFSDCSSTRGEREYRDITSSSLLQVSRKEEVEEPHFQPQKLAMHGWKELTPHSTEGQETSTCGAQREQKKIYKSHFILCFTPGHPPAGPLDLVTPCSFRTACFNAIYVLRFFYFGALL